MDITSNLSLETFVNCKVQCSSNFYYSYNIFMKHYVLHNLVCTKYMKHFESFFRIQSVYLRHLTWQIYGAQHVQPQKCNKTRFDCK